MLTREFELVVLADREDAEAWPNTACSPIKRCEDQVCVGKPDYHSLRRRAGDHVHGATERCPLAGVVNDIQSKNTEKKLMAYSPNQPSDRRVLRVNVSLCVRN